MNNSDEEILIFLINRYVMINGKYYRDMPPELQAEYLPDVITGHGDNEQQRVAALTHLFFQHGAIRGVRLAQMSEQQRFDILATGRTRMLNYQRTQNELRTRQAAEKAARIAEHEVQTAAKEGQLEAARCAARDAPYRYSADAVAKVLRGGDQVHYPSVVALAPPSGRFSPSYIATELGIPHEEAIALLRLAAERGDLLARPDGWFERTPE
ncbi:hypothetical protein [Burkholderia gladioli]|uniref:hypothetical protein n=1 Tax=Burkholderia gladioli TaxID=28095 RepID=UPI00163E46EB|nr:hypothetical protein [Burkholderia gladioli]